MGDVDCKEVNKWKHWLKSDLFYEALTNKINNSKNSLNNLICKLVIDSVFILLGLGNHREHVSVKLDGADL